MRLLLIFLLVVEYSYAQVTYRPGLVAAYTFSHNAYDSGPNGYHGIGKGLVSFNDTLTVPNDYNSFFFLPADAFTGLGDFTIYCQFKLLIINADLNLIFSGATPSNSNYFTLYYIRWQGKWGFSYQGTNYTFDATIPEANRWYCLMLTRVNDTFSLYIDNVKASNDLTIDNQPLNLQNTGLILGQEQDCVGGCFEPEQNLNGKLDNFSVFNRALDPEEIGKACIDPVTKIELPLTEEAILPNVITPNNDEWNEYLKFDLGFFLEIQNFIICNRWGKIVYTAEKYNNDWNAPSQSTGIYYYYFTAKGVKYKSWLSVLR